MPARVCAVATRAGDGAKALLLDAGEILLARVLTTGELKTELTTLGRRTMRRRMGMSVDGLWVEEGGRKLRREGGVIIDCEHLIRWLECRLERELAASSSWNRGRSGLSGAGLEITVTGGTS
jgi:hypothetical protein